MGVCKLYHVIPPGGGYIDSELMHFDETTFGVLYYRICKCIYSDLTWFQATLPCLLGGIASNGFM